MKKVRLFFGIILILLIEFSCRDSKYKEAIGKEYRTLTEFDVYKGFEDVGGVMIENLNNTDYGMGHLKKNTIDLIAFEKILRQQSGSTRYILLDILEISGLQSDQYIAYGLCRYNEKPDSEIIAIYNYEEDVEYYKSIVKAWRANRKSGCIESIEVKGIDCINEGYGVE